MSYRRRISCLRRLAGALKAVGATIGVNVQETVWDDSGFRTIINESDIYLNLHNDCAHPHNPLETFRLAKLLNAHALMISERSHPSDEREFEDLISFVKTGLTPLS